jgi:hypothetical protein
MIFYKCNHGHLYLVSGIHRGHELTASTMRVLFMDIIHYNACALLDVMNSIIHYSNLHV